MCLAPNIDPGAAAAPDDAIPAASALALGSVPRGAAGLGRLKLRLGGTSTAAKAPTPAASTAAPTDSATANSGAPDQAPATEGVVATQIKRVPNSSLRIAAEAP